VTLDMNAMVHAAVAEARAVHTGPDPRIDIEPLPPAAADATVMRHVWSNIIGNALKYSSRRAQPEIRISGRVDGDETIYKVQDNGVGFDMRYASRLFGVFKRLHSVEDFPGTGVGLAIAQRVISRHGGRIWAEGEPDAGACIHFTLPNVSIHQA
jgi:light-regulated signal transduction histidine kinase (bacteriophytochrome)